jgi:hypothetical protein
MTNLLTETLDTKKLTLNFSLSFFIVAGADGFLTIGDRFRGRFSDTSRLDACGVSSALSNIE